MTWRYPCERLDCVWNDGLMCGQVSSANVMTTDGPRCKAYWPVDDDDGREEPDKCGEGSCRL